MCIMCLSPPNRRNEQRKATERRKNKKIFKKVQKMLDKVSELMYNVVTRTRLTQPTTKSDENANHQ